MRLYTSDESKRRLRFWPGGVQPVQGAAGGAVGTDCYAERHDNIEAIYKKLSERRDTADVSELLKLLHRIVNQAIATQGAGGDQASGSDGGPLADQHGKAARGVRKKVKRKATVIEDIRQLVEKKLAQMLAAATRCA
jgi:type I restriction enzyme R subunit